MRFRPLLAAIAVALFTGPASPAATPSANLLAHWRLDETSGTLAADTSSAARTATLSGSPVWTSSGRVVGALDFPGGAARASFTSPALSGPVTLAAWVRIDGLPAGTFPRILSMPGCELMVIYNSGSAPLLHFESIRTTTNGRWRSAAGSVPTGRWVHLAATYDPAASAPTLYIDGVALPATVNSTPSGALVANTGTGHLANNAAATRGLDGALDEVVIYDRVLSASELAGLALSPYAGAPAAANRLVTAALAAPGAPADTDADGAPDRLERALGLDPHDPLDAALASADVALAPARDALLVSHFRPEPPPALGPRPVVETGLLEGAWSTAGITPEFAVAAPADGRRLVTARVPFAPGETRRFARVAARDPNELDAFTFPAVRDLWARLLVGHQARTNAAGTRWPNNDLEGPTRMLWSLGAWLSRPERPRTLAWNGQTADLADLTLRALKNGSNPSEPTRWPLSSGYNQQMVVEAPNVAFAAWALRQAHLATSAGSVWSQLTGTDLANLNALLRDQDNSLYPHNWNTFVILNHEVRKRLDLSGVPAFASWSQTQIDTHLARVNSVHFGGGWHTDDSTFSGLPVFEDYQNWGYASHLLLWTLLAADDAPAATVIPGTNGLDRAALLDRVSAQLSTQPWFYDVHGAHPEYGRSTTYKFARLVGLALAYSLDRTKNTAFGWNLPPVLPPDVSVGQLRRLLRLHLNHYLALGMIDPADNTLRERQTPWSDPEVMEGYSTPGSTNWAAFLFAPLWLLPEDDLLWTTPEEPLPTEKFDSALWIEPAGFLVRSSRADGHVELFNTRVDKTTVSYYENKYDKFVYSSALGFLTRSGGRLDNSLQLSDTTWRRTPSAGDQWLPADLPADAPGVLRSVHVQGSRRASTLIFLRDGLQVRVHRVTGAAGRIREGGYALGHFPDETLPAPVHGPDWTYLRSSTGATMTARLLGFTATSTTSGAGRHSRHPAWRLAWNDAPSAADGAIVATLVKGSRHPFDPAAVRAQVSSVSADATGATVTWIDGSSTAAPFLP